MREYRIECNKCKKECDLHLLEYNGFFIKTYFCSGCKKGLTEARNIEEVTGWMEAQ